MFITEDFLLDTDSSKKLYEAAKTQPIFDYHCHLDPELILSDYRYLNITELWLAGDHYKWRAMRANGLSETYITGEASAKEKFHAWAQTVEKLVGNPLYHWTHLELKEYFGVTELLSSETAEEIYQKCNAFLENHQVTTRTLIRQSNVRLVGTTDDLDSDLHFHKAFRKEKELFKMVPTFRPDTAIKLDATFSETLSNWQEKFGVRLSDYGELLAFLKQRIDYFDEAGCLSADHGLGMLYYADISIAEMNTLFRKAAMKQELSEVEKLRWQGRILVDLAKEYHEKGWVMQLHFGVIRNNNTRLLKAWGTDAGADSIMDQSNIAVHLNHFLDALDQTNQLPKTIVYNLDGTLNEIAASTIGNYQGNEEGICSKLQLGAGWWFNDTYPGMIRQLEVFENYGLLTTFVGMLTDSRSFISYPRHDYFRRILCQFIGNRVEKGFYPDDEQLLNKMVQGISYENAEKYFMT